LKHTTGNNKYTAFEVPNTYGSYYDLTGKAGDVAPFEFTFTPTAPHSNNQYRSGYYINNAGDNEENYWNIEVEFEKGFQTPTNTGYPNFPSNPKLTDDIWCSINGKIHYCWFEATPVDTADTSPTSQDKILKVTIGQRDA
jgi:hypothetical protein